MFLVSVNEMDKSCERDGGELCQTFLGTSWKGLVNDLGPKL
jgi:hypothetical protein